MVAGEQVQPIADRAPYRALHGVRDLMSQRVKVPANHNLATLTC